MNEEERIRRYINVPNWICEECGTTVFGRCKTCAYCREKLGKVTERESLPYDDDSWDGTPKVDEYEDEA